VREQIATWQAFQTLSADLSNDLEIVSEITDEVANTDLSSLELSDLQSKLQNCQKVCDNFSPNVNGGQVGI